MAFTHDTDDALQSAAALVNTAARPGEPDGLADAADLRAFEQEWQWTGRFDGTPEELAGIAEQLPNVATVELSDSTLTLVTA